MGALSRPLALVAFAAATVLAGCGSVSGLETRARILSEPPCTDFFFPIYFADRSSALSKPAVKVVDNAGRHASGCTVASVEVIGLADYKGSTGDNLVLSRERAQHVAEALQRAGLPAPVFHLTALGETGSAANGTAVPLRRRADVFIRFAR